MKTSGSNYWQILVRFYSIIHPHRRILQPKSNHIQRRYIISAVLRHALKLRLWILPGLIGGGLAAANKYEEWKRSLPDISIPSWMKFDEKPLNNFTEAYKKLWINESAKNGNWLNELYRRMRTFKDEWHKGPPEDGISGKHDFSSFDFISQHELTAQLSEGVPNFLSSLASKFYSPKSSQVKAEGESEYVKLSEAERMQKLQDEMLKTQSQYQRELQALEKENKALKQRLLLKDQGASVRSKRVKRSLIDLYSEVLDLLSEYDSSYSTADNLPRIVVVGDQSSGKTSVLEMIARARIFPRGTGEMMTRAPVKVTLSEGPYHLAQFKDSDREFDLTKESELKSLRNEIEVRMRNSVQQGKTVSNEVIALTVKGPSIPRMVLIDLPGVISTVTVDMAKGTKDDIVKMCQNYMENPNAIILCIQDGSVDAERSNVTDLVSSIDPLGRRTILVLTKVDMAEQNYANPDRIKKILEGKLFPMQALGYFAVVAGKGSSADSIESILKYEEDFFANSRLFKEGVLKTSQMTTRNMSFTVSDCFWRMVKDSIESQADAFRATRYNLETEWKNAFPRARELDRDELFEKAKGEILDEIVNLSLIDAENWENLLKKRLWNSVTVHIFDQILMPLASVDSAVTFNTSVDIKLKHWVDTDLSLKSVQAGLETLIEVFKQQIESDANKLGHDQLFDQLKAAIVETTVNEHVWDSKALDYLRVIQLNAMEDRLVPDKRSWDHATNFMATAVHDRLKEIRHLINHSCGPGLWSRWLRWQSLSKENFMTKQIQQELQQLLTQDADHGQVLSDDDLTFIRRNLEAKGIENIPFDSVRRNWKHLFKKHFLERQLLAARDCQDFYQYYKGGFNDTEVDCQAVILFHRIKRMIDLTCNALRQQITNTEQRRLEQEIKNVLDDWYHDEEKKKTYLTGRRVELAEELKQVRHIQEKLEAFMAQLQKEKS